MVTELAFRVKCHVTAWFNSVHRAQSSPCTFTQSSGRFGKFSLGGEKAGFGFDQVQNGNKTNVNWV